MFCSNCGKELPEATKFCPECGKAVAAVNGSAAQPVTTTALVVADNVSSKSRVCALLLGIFLGIYGIHNFYLGKIGKGIAQLLITIAAALAYLISIFYFLYNSMEDYFYVPVLAFLLVLFAVKIWVMVDWILIATGNGKDKNGLAVTRW